MSPKRLIPYARTHHWFIGVIGVCCVAVIFAFILVANQVRHRTQSVNQSVDTLAELVYESCVANETQDHVIVAQLQAAKWRAKATLPRNSAVLANQLRVLNDGINALEPPDEKDCQPPEGTQP